MASTHKPFRELIQSGSSFEFVGRARLFGTLSILLIIASIASVFVNNAVRGDYMNWTTDFKGGTEVIFAFRDKDSGAYKAAGAGEVRKALAAADLADFEVSGFSWDQDLPGGGSQTVEGMLVRTPSFGVVSQETGDAIIASFEEQLQDTGILNIRWSGDRLYIRSQKPLDEAKAKEILTSFGLEMKPWNEQALQYLTADQSTDEYQAQVAAYGIERQFARVIEEQLGMSVDLVQSYAVGARAGAELRNDGIKSLFYATALIMLYLAFRFDIRYAPGAVVALLHDAIVVIGVFAVTWTEVSLTTVAALLTIIGYSVNDTVIIFDRIRENVDRLKDKRLSRIINISLNEVLSRSLLTSVTVLVVTLAMNVFSTGLVSNFAFAMNIGVVVGAYSSLYIAAPVMMWIDEKLYSGRAAQPAAAKKSAG